MTETTTATCGSMDYAEGEFLPPLDEPEAWAMPWEQQIDAARAWQEAQANTDGEACQWGDWASHARHGSPALTMRTGA